VPLQNAPAKPDAGIATPFPPFQPLLRNPHWLTMAAAAWPRSLDTERFPVETRRIPTEPGVEIVVATQRPNRKVHGEVILVHGLEGSSEGRYMRGLAQTLLEARFAVHRMNIRFCGAGEAASRTLYHAGLTIDLRTLAGRCEMPPFLIGFSLGGNQVLKLVGEMGTGAVGRLSGAIAVSTPIDLLGCSRKMETGWGPYYAKHFLRSMKRRLKRREAQVDFQPDWERVQRAQSIFDFDDCVTAPAFGFRGAEHYYETQSSKGFLHSIAVPTLLLHSTDDPMVDSRAFGHTAFRSNPELTLLVTQHGGHVGFVSSDPANRFWVDRVARDWISARALPL
jgi:uncharacterized protein